MNKATTYNLPSVAVIATGSPHSFHILTMWLFSAFSSSRKSKAYKNMHGDKIAERIAAQKEAMRQARKEIEEAEDEHHE